MNTTRHFLPGDGLAKLLSWFQFAVPVVIASVVSLSLVACDSVDSNDLFEVEGQILNVTDQPVRNATVALTGDNGASTASTTTNSEGTYRLTQVESGTYTITYSAAGYDNTTVSITVDDQNVNVGTDVLLGQADISGQVVDARTGSGVDGATIAFVHNEAGNPDLADLLTETGADGFYSIVGGPTGIFTLTVRLDGYLESVVSGIEFRPGSNAFNPRSISEALDDGSYRIVLSWGESPRDLDAHLTGPREGGGRFHVAYYNRNPSGADADLDRDDVSSFGPETITINSLRDGMYRYSVHNFSNQSTNGAVGIHESPAEVQLYDAGGLIASYVAPEASPGDGNAWRVFELIVDGEDIQLSDENGATFGYVQVSSPRDDDSFLRIPSPDGKHAISQELF